MARRVRVRAHVTRRLATLSRLDPAAAAAVAEAIALLGNDLTPRRLARLGVVLRGVRFDELPGVTMHLVVRANRYVVSRTTQESADVLDVI